MQQIPKKHRKSVRKHKIRFGSAMSPFTTVASTPLFQSCLWPVHFPLFFFLSQCCGNPGPSYRQKRALLHSWHPAPFSQGNIFSGSAVQGSPLLCARLPYECISFFAPACFQRRFHQGQPHSWPAANPERAPLPGREP